MCKPCMYIHAIFRTLAYLESETSSNQAYSEPWHSQNSLFKYFQGYLGIFKDIDGYSATLRHYSFSKRLHLSCICLNNCSVIYTVTLRYVLHETYSEFWHIQNSVSSGIFRHIQAYSVLLRNY